MLEEAEHLRISQVQESKCESCSGNLTDGKQSTNFFSSTGFDRLYPKVVMLPSPRNWTKDLDDDRL
jgi:hypothetical protein